MKTKKTITDSTVDPDILAYTVGDDPVLDLALAKWDCMGTAAHVTMLSEMKGLKRPVVTTGRFSPFISESIFTCAAVPMQSHFASARSRTGSSPTV